IDEVNQFDENYRKDRPSLASTEQNWRPCCGVEKERRCGFARSATAYRYKEESLPEGFQAKRSTERVRTIGSGQTNESLIEPDSSSNRNGIVLTESQPDL